ncbi:MAG TPA: FkbM family methyltransferase [Aestuariivirga sp.]
MRDRIKSWLNKHNAQPGPNRIVNSTYGPMIINMNDTHIGYSIRETGIWEFNEINTLIKLGHHLAGRLGQINFHDVGANVGMHTLAIAKSLEGRCRVRAFEPQEPIFHMLCGTMALNNLQNVQCHCNVVSAEVGHILEVEFPDYASPNNFGGFEFVPSRNSDNQNMIRSPRCHKVSTISIDSFAEPVHLMKIDVEGMEDQVLRGAEKTIRTFRPICHLEVMKTDVEFVKAFFLQRNYTFLPRGGDVLAVPHELLDGLPLP